MWSVQLLAITMGAAPGLAVAEPIVLNSTVVLVGTVQIHQGNTFSEESIQSPHGAQAFADTLTVARDGAIGTVEGAVSVFSSPGRMSYHGASAISTVQGPTVAVDTALHMLSTNSFSVTEPTVFRWTARTLLEGGGRFSGGISRVGVLSPLFHDIIDSPRLLTFERSGVLEPGRYVGAASNQFGIFSKTNDRLAGSFDVTLDLAPAVPAVPEPTSLVLLGTALVAVAGRRWNAKRQTLTRGIACK
jgi:hypothetical protein